MIIFGKGGDGRGDRDTAESQNSTCRRINTQQGTMTMATKKKKAKKKTK
jgi:hypothetical protein